MRYGFFVHEYRKTSINEACCDSVAFAEVNYRLGGHDALTPKLRPCVLHLLEQGRYEAGLYCCSYCEIVGESEPGECLTECFVAWDGEREVVPAPA